MVKNFRETVSYLSSRGVVREFVFYLVSSKDEIKISNEHSEYKWIASKETKTYFEYNDILELLNKAEKTIHEGI